MKKYFFLALFLGLFSISFAQNRVNGSRAIITLHPTKINIESKDGREYFLLYSLETKSLFILSSKENFELIENHLPVFTINGRSVVLDGASINLFQIFSRKELNKASRRIGQNLKKITAFQVTNIGLLGSNDKNQRW